MNKTDILDNINKLYNFIGKLVIMLEDQLELIKREDNDVSTTIKAQKTITDILNKLVLLISQLNKLLKDDLLKEEIKIIPEQDAKIIDRFLKRYQFGSHNQ